MKTLIKTWWPVPAVLTAVVLFCLVVGRWADEHAPFLPEVEYREPAPYVTAETFAAWAKVDLEWKQLALMRAEQIEKGCSTPPKKAKK